MRCLDGITESTDMNLGKLREIVKNREAWCAAFLTVAKSRTRLSNWIELTFQDHKIWETSQFCCCSVAKSCDSLWPHGLQHTRLLCPSLSLRVCTNSCPLSQWCHPNISFSVTCFFCWLLWPLLTKHNFSSKEQASFYFVAAVTICSDFGAQEYKICYCFYFLPTYLP